MYLNMTSTRELKTWMTILLFAILFLINVEGQIGNAEEDLLIFRALEKALLTEKNLYVLQNKIYTGLMRNSYSNIIIFHEDFIVKNVSYARSKNEDNADDNDLAFQYNESCNCSERVGNSFSCIYYCELPCGALYDNIYVSNPAAVLSLSKYIQNCLYLVITHLDIPFFQLLAYFTDLSQRQSEDNTKSIYDEVNNISLIVDNLPVNTTGSELKYALQNLLKWVKYYARTGQTLSNSNQILDTDVILAEYTCDGSPFVNFDCIYSLSLVPIAVFCLNFVIMITGYYIVWKLSSGTFSFSLKELTFTSINAKIVIFWPVAAILFLVNLFCFIYELCYWLWHLNLFFLVLDVPLIGFFTFFTLIEICIIHYMTRNVLTIDRFFCISRPKCFVRAIQTYAICNILWFAHRVGNCFLLSIFFIAVQPAPALAAITLCINGIIIAILLVVATTHLFLSHDRVKTCIKISKLFLIVFYFICIIGFMTVFTLIFVDLTKHGLSASDVGTIILSVSVGIMSAFVSIAGKKYFDKLNIGSNVLNDGYIAIQENN